MCEAWDRSDGVSDRERACASVCERVSTRAFLLFGSRWVVFVYARACALEEFNDIQRWHSRRTEPSNHGALIATDTHTTARHNQNRSPPHERLKIAIRGAFVTTGFAVFGIYGNICENVIHCPGSEY